jgi:hypothetical protein
MNLRDALRAGHRISMAATNRLQYRHRVVGLLGAFATHQDLDLNQFRVAAREYRQRLSGDKWNGELSGSEHLSSHAARRGNATQQERHYVADEGGSHGG